MLSSQLIKDAIKKHKLELPRLQKLHNYYIGQNEAILNRKLPDPHKPNNKIVTVYPKTIVDTVVGFLAAHPLSYISKSNNEKFLDDLRLVNYINNEEDTNAEIIKSFSIFGKCYELHYTDTQGRIRYNYYSPLEMYVEMDKHDIKFGIRHWEERLDENTKVIKVEAYDSDGMYRFISHDNGDTFTLDNSENDYQKEHYYGEAPICVYLNNEEEKGDFESFIPMIDSLDLMLSDSANELESWVNSYLLLAGYKGTTPEDLAKMKQDGILLLDDIAQAKFLTKETHTEFQQNFFETIDNLIHEQSSTPRLTSEQFSSNLSGQALGFKLFGLTTKSSVKERKMERALRKRIRLICTMLNKQGKEYDPSDIRFSFVHNIPADEAGITDQIIKLNHMLPLETRLSWHPRVQDPAAEIKKLKNESDSSSLDLDLMFKQGGTDE
ncbi:MAG: phage portal protein [Bacillaceae bacterium]|nr:phage portal protein [Bacillaceae bacterium]